MREKGESLKSAFEALKISRNSQYRRGTKKTASAMNQVLLEKLKELRLGHPFWGYRRKTAWLKYREALPINRKRIHRLMRENGLWVDELRHKALRTAQRAKPKATRPNQSWGIDMTKFLLGPLGWCNLIVVLDWSTKEIVGWNLSLRTKTSEWRKALDGALCEKFPLSVPTTILEAMPRRNG